MIRRFLFRNERNLFRRRDSRTGEEIFSSFPNQAPLTVYERDYWWSDQWDSMEYGRDYDFSRPFFEQFRELLTAVPVFSKSTLGAVNSDYCDQVGWIRNSYLCFDAGGVENSAYIVKASEIKDSFDLYESICNERCYDSLMIDDCYRVFFSMDCDHCTDVWFSKDMMGCNNCFGCANLRNKSYYIFNEPLTKEQYVEKLKQFDLGSTRLLKDLRERTKEFWLKFPVKYLHGYHNVNVSGEHIQEAKNVHQSYSFHKGQDSKYAQVVWAGITDAYDFTNFGYKASQIYECVTCGFQAQNLKFCWECWDAVHDLEYCAFCSTSSHLFGCVGLRKKQYCIFNKQYSREEYEALREKIVAHMNELPFTDTRGETYRYGEFFPHEFSPFAYNETFAQDVLPLTQEQTRVQGYLWREQEAREFQTTMDAQNLPDHIRDVLDSVLKEIIRCDECGRAYRIIPSELAFYRSVGIALPRACPNCRFLERVRLTNPPRFWRRTCQCQGASDERGIYRNASAHFHDASRCPNKFETSYAPERPEIVYCESCYNSEVV